MSACTSATAISYTRHRRARTSGSRASTTITFDRDMRAADASTGREAQFEDVTRPLPAGGSLEADVPPVVELEVDDVVLEEDHAFGRREVACAAHDRMMAATVELLRERVVHVLRREGVGRLECSATAVQA